MEPVFKTSTKKMSIISLKKQVKSNKPVVLSHDIPPGTKLSFVDISHSLATIEIESKFNKFSALIGTANDWLQKNYLWKVESCETVSLVFKNDKLDPIDFGATQRLLQPSIRHDSDDCLTLKSLRLWISRREDIFEKPEIKRHLDLQTIACQTFLPQSCKYYENQIGWEQLDDVVETINEYVRCGQISGQLLNIESVNYDADEEWVVDTECPKQREFNTKQETALRVYYVVNAPTDTTEEVAVFDFVPEIISANSPPKFEPFSTLLYKMQEFLEDNQEFQLLNCQSVDIRFKGLDEIHTHFMVHNNDIGYYLRILRLICIKSPVLFNRRLCNQWSIDDTIHPNGVKSQTDVLSEELAQKGDNCTESEADDKVGPLAKPKPPVLNIESHCMEVIQQNTLHGPFYPVKRAIEEFMEREEWTADESLKWRYLCAETIVVLAKDESDIAKRVEMSLFSNRNNILLMPRTYNCCRIYFDTSLVIRSVVRNVKSFSKSKSESFEKEFKTMSFRQRSLPDTAVHYMDSTAQSIRSAKNVIKHSLSCLIM